MNAEEARNRLLQAYGEEVTIRRTLPRTSGRGGFQTAREKLRRPGSRLSCTLQRNADLTASLLAAPRPPEKTQETPELANSLKKKRAKPEVLPGREK
jgi:hypothetical protein